jgi:hypothetical protein
MLIQDVSLLSGKWQKGRRVRIMTKRKEKPWGNLLLLRKGKEVR